MYDCQQFSYQKRVLDENKRFLSMLNIFFVLMQANQTINIFYIEREVLENMIKDILRRVKISIVAVITVLFCVTVPEVSDVGAAVEGGTDIRLKLQRKTIDIDDIPDDRIVSLDISIENNTQIDAIGFIIEKDSRLEYNGYDVFQGVNSLVGGSSHNTFNTQNILFTNVFFADDLYEDNGVFGQLKIKLPDKSNIKVGDHYQIKFVPSYETLKPRVAVLVPEAKILDGAEYFGGFEDGEIEITDEDDNPSTEPAQNDTEPQHKPVEQSPSPEQNQNNDEPGQANGNSNNVQTQAESVTLPVTTVSQTTAALTSVVTTVKVTKATSVSTIAGTEYAETDVSTQTDIKDEVTSASEKNDNNGKSNIKVIICVAAIIAVLVSVLTVALKTRKRRNNDEK